MSAVRSTTPSGVPFVRGGCSMLAPMVVCQGHAVAVVFAVSFSPPCMHASMDGCSLLLADTVVSLHWSVHLLIVLLVRGIAVLSLYSCRQCFPVAAAALPICPVRLSLCYSQPTAAELSATLHFFASSSTFASATTALAVVYEAIFAASSYLCFCPASHRSSSSLAAYRLANSILNFCDPLLHYATIQNHHTI